MLSIIPDIFSHLALVDPYATMMLIPICKFTRQLYFDSKTQTHQNIVAYLCSCSADNAETLISRLLDAGFMPFLRYLETCNSLTLAQSRKIQKAIDNFPGYMFKLISRPALEWVYRNIEFTSDWDDHRQETRHSLQSIDAAIHDTYERDDPTLLEVNVDHRIEWGDWTYETLLVKPKIGLAIMNHPKGKNILASLRTNYNIEQSLKNGSWDCQYPQHKIVINWIRKTLLEI